MSKIDDIFVLNEYGDLEINKPEVKNKAAYAEIYNKSKPTKGDFDGKKKIMANKELLYIYLMHNPSSMYKALPEELRREKVIDHCGLPTGWEEDKIMIVASAQYQKDLKLNATANAYLSADKALMNLTLDLNDNNDLLQSYKIKLNKIIAKIRDVEGDTTTVTLIQESAAIVSAITGLQENQVKIIEKLPKLANIVNELAAKYAEEGGMAKLVVGGGETFNREE